MTATHDELCVSREPAPTPPKWEIRKRPKDYVGANLADYNKCANTFSWTEARALLLADLNQRKRASCEAYFACGRAMIVLKFPICGWSAALQKANGLRSVTLNHEVLAREEIHHGN